MRTDRATIFVMDGGNTPSEDYLKVVTWFDRWSESVTVFGYSTGGAEHIWDVEGSQEAIQDIPGDFKTNSAWLERTGSNWRLQSSPLSTPVKPPSRRR